MRPFDANLFIFHIAFFTAQSEGMDLDECLTVALTAMEIYAAELASGGW